MSILMYPLFFLPPHRHSWDKYYQKRDEWIEQQKRKIVDPEGKTFDQLSKRQDDMERVLAQTLAFLLEI